MSYIPNRGDFIWLNSTSQACLRLDTEYRRFETPQTGRTDLLVLRFLKKLVLFKDFHKPGLIIINNLFLQGFPWIIKLWKNNQLFLQA